MTSPPPFLLSPENHDPAPAPGPRTWVLAAAGTALLVAGLVGGYAIGVRSASATSSAAVISPAAENPAADSAGPAAAPTAAASAVTPVDQSARFTGTEAAVLAEPWLPEISNCVSDKDNGGPKLENGRTEAINCRIGDLQLYFETFRTAKEFGWTRDYREQASRKSRTLVPGAETPRQKTGTTTGKTGTYFEYVTGQTCGLFWTHAGSLTDLRLETDCASIDDSWPALRGVWNRFS
ncbi:hypothetical protein SAMN04489716_7957 [Actinoplanes derwentensis]|uniref:Uncharacterized protein n=2 Tax=Actinoplanes derwentensis TaxID=113562 RepID=A0A1H2D4C1_9ACTN|nr:hypothetical protein Ade03nite_49280 [Actinoplanes derwentensis]SDT77434.1 hypothetical protein SAMN04489716_7957 [Actinoplanes derwentensis]